MIAYCGHFGSGKTYNMTKELKKYYNSGAFIITNYNTSFSHCIITNINELMQILTEIFSIKQMEKEIIDYFPNFNINEQIVFGLDEGGIYFSARDWQNWNKPELCFLLDFMLQCRKLDVEIITTVQAPALLDINFRRIITEWYYCKPIIFGINSKTPYFLSPEKPIIEQGEKLGTTSFFWLGSKKIHSLYNHRELCCKSSYQLKSNFPILDEAHRRISSSLAPEVPASDEIFLNLKNKISIHRNGSGNAVS